MILINKKKITITVRGILILLTVSLLLAYVRKYLPIDTSQNTAHINREINSNLLKVIFPLFLSPIAEEWIFRKWIPNTFQDVVGRKQIIVLSNILFSLFHFDLYFIPYLINGLIYSWYYERTKDLRIPITMHIVYNLFVLLVTNIKIN